MKARLVLTPHAVLPGQSVIEVWHADRLVCTVVGADGPGIRVISKHVSDSAPVIAKNTVTGMVELLFE